MAKVTVRRNGFSAGVAGPGRKQGDDGQTRGNVRGWSLASARRNAAWLQSVDPDYLPDEGGLALTLTMGGWPESAAEFHAARRAFLRVAENLGFDRWHWVIESTRLGRPHLHLAMYGVDARSWARWMLVSQWALICDRRGWTAEVRAQTVEPITSLTGWLQYVSKHGSRGVTHYQRSTPPRGWEESTGRLWGHGGNWPCPEPLEVELTEAEFHRFRRLAVSLARSRLRALGVSSTVAQRVGSQMRSPHPDVSRRAGVGYWLHGGAAEAMISISLGREPVIRYFDWE